MALTRLSTEAVEESTLVVIAAFTDEDGNAVVPDSVAWSLTKNDGTPINGRDQVSITPASTVNIVLSGDDLALETAEQAEESVLRRVLVEAVYDSSYGNNLPLKDSCSIVVRNLKYIS